jgi:hypothetical protein
VVTTLVNLGLGWLLLADIYLNQGKGDQAMAILRTVLAHNAVSIFNAGNAGH